ncbi:hypothetical protein BdWA1_000376 [Babesia duncani]|uniref:Uncharacterized protein n=1 Tax=Babesia duncani TaxID=323732 RepID=A0AAD9PM82_9APIC|nr:hypothetical protein BdWA1_000376 [Babesia duncani]
MGQVGMDGIRRNTSIHLDAMTQKLVLLLETLSKVQETALKFRNPSFAHYFSKKAEDQIASIQSEGQKLTESEISKQLEENIELHKILQRQTMIHNSFYSAESMVDK